MKSSMLFESLRDRAGAHWFYSQGPEEKAEVASLSGEPGRRALQSSARQATIRATVKT